MYRGRHVIYTDYNQDAYYPAHRVHGVHTHTHTHKRTHAHTPGLTVLADQANKRVDLCSSDVFLQQLAVVMQQSRDCVLGQDIIANLFLHEAKLFGYVLLQDRQTNSLSTRKTETRWHRLTVEKRNFITNVVLLSLIWLCLYPLLTLTDKGPSVFRKSEHVHKDQSAFLFNLIK